MHLTIACSLQASTATIEPAFDGELDAQMLQHAVKVLGGQNESIASLQGYVDQAERDIAIVTEAARGPDLLTVSAQQ